MGTGSTQISKSNATSLRRVITKTHPPTSLPKSSRVSWAAAASRCQGPPQGPETGQNPAPCSAQLPRTSTPSPQPMGHNVDPQNAQSSLSPTHTHTPAGILCPWKNTAGAASPQGTLLSHKPTASCGLHYKTGLIPLVADPTANSTFQGKPRVKSLQLTLAEVTQCTPKHKYN